MIKSPHRGQKPFARLENPSQIEPLAIATLRCHRFDSIERGPFNKFAANSSSSTANNRFHAGSVTFRKFGISATDSQ